MFLLSIEIVIFEDINGKSPFIGRNALLMAPMSEHQLNIKVTNAKTSYSITQGAELISISKLGKISSNDMLGTAVILVQATESDTRLVQVLSLKWNTVSKLNINLKEDFNKVGNIFFSFISKNIITIFDRFWYC